MSDTGKFIIIGIGAVMLALAAVSFGYTVTPEQEILGGVIQDTQVDRPYRDLSWPLGVGGIVLIVVGAFIPSQSRKEGSA